MPPTETTKYGDKVTAGYAPGQSGLAVYDSKTGSPLSGAQSYNPNTGQAITSELLKSTANLKLPNATTPTFGGLSGATEAVTSQAKTDQQIALDQAKGNADTSLKDLLQETLNQGSISSSVDRTVQDAAQKEVNNYTSQLEQEQLANRRAIEAVTSGGLITKEQAANEAAAINRASLSKQADIAILQSAANRNYDTAASIADRAVAMKLEQSNARLSALKLFYEDNKATFNKQEERAYSEKIREQERELKKKEEFEKTISDIKLNVAQSDAPNKAQLLSSLSGVTTLDEALKVAGQYSGDYLKAQLLKEQIKTERAQRDNYNASAAKTRSETGGGTGNLKLTDAQVQNAGFADRINQSNTIIDNKADTFKNLNYAQFKLLESKSPLANSLLSSDQQEVGQAMRNFITAKLRKESGAAISPTEFEDARLTYFPTLGDSDVVLQNKKNLRDSVLNNLVLGSDGAYTQKTTTVDSAPNKFQQATGQTNQTFNTTNLSVKPDGSLDWSLPGVTK